MHYPSLQIRILLVLSCIATAVPGQDLFDVPDVPVDTARLREEARSTGDDGLRPTADLPESVYLDNIAALERAGGPLAPGIADQLIGLGYLYREAGQHGQAALAFERALQIRRIERGLHHVDHLPLVELVIASHSARSDWVETNRYYRYLYWVVMRERAELGTEAAELLLRIADWHLRAHRRDTGQHRQAHLDTATAALAEATAIIRSRYGTDDPRLAWALILEVTTDFYVALYMHELNAHQIVSTRSDVDEILRRQHIIMNKYRHGKTTLEQLVELRSEAPDPAARADAMVSLADWYLLFGRHFEARRAYEEAYAHLRSTGASREDADARWRRPVTLPSMWLGPVAPVPPPDGPHVLARFDVTRDGRARRIETEVRGAGDARQFERQVRRSVAQAVYRPRIEDGETVSASGIEMTFEIDGDTHASP